MSTVADTPTPIRLNRRMIAPIACGCAAVAMAGVLTVVDPSDQQVLPPCPFHTVTGLWCPGCGMTRATHALLQGDVARAFGFNLLTPMILGLLVAGWWSWLRSSAGRPSTWWDKVPTAVWFGLAAVAVAFAVLRNLPAFAVLAP